MLCVRGIARSGKEANINILKPQMHSVLQSEIELYCVIPKNCAQRETSKEVRAL